MTIVSYFIGFIKIEPFEGDSKGYSVKTMEKNFQLQVIHWNKQSFFFTWKKEGLQRLVHRFLFIPRDS